MDQSVQNTAELRSLNKKKIIQYLRSVGESTKKEIAEYIDLSFSTVSNLCNQLAEDGLITYISSNTSNGGRMPQLLSLDLLRRFIISINLIQSYEIKISVSNLVGEVIWLTNISLVRTVTYDNLLDDCVGGIMKLLNRHTITLDQLIGIGVAIPGIQDQDTETIINSTLSLLENQSITRDLSVRLGLSVYAENDSNLMGLASLTAEGVPSDAADLVYIYIGEGLGTGIINNKVLLTGAHGFAGEIGHIPLGVRNFECYCGKQGCIESEVAATGFIHKYNQSCAQPINTSQSMDEQWQQFATLVKQGDTTALSVIQENGKLLGMLLSILVNLFDPEIVILGGYTNLIFDDIKKYILQEASQRFVTKRTNDTPILMSDNEQQLIVKGCCELVLAQWRP